MSYELIQTVNVGAGGASSILFENIPQDGIDLVVVYQTGSGVTSNIGLAINGSTSGISGKEIEAVNSYVGTNSRNSSWGGYQQVNAFNSGQIYFSNYTSNGAKPHAIEVTTGSNSGTNYTYFAARNWNGPAAITSLQLSVTMQNNSTASLYKVY
jgi:hypothetical protein